MTTTGLAIENLTVGYRPGQPILKNASLTVERGEMTALIGANGSGKSTLLHALMGLVRPTSGEMRLDGCNLTQQLGPNVGFCADDLPLPELLTGREYLHLMTRVRDVRVTPNAVTKLFESLNMAGAERRLIKEFSHGMKRKVQLLANVLHSPDLLVLDEPFRGLDPESHALVVQLLEFYVGSGRLVFLSTHDLRVAAGHCTRAVKIENGSTRSLELASMHPRHSEDHGDSERERSRNFFEVLDAVGRP